MELTLPVDPSQLVVSIQRVEDADWGPYYKVFPTFGKIWDDTQEASKVWPEKIKGFEGRSTRRKGYVFPHPFRSHSLDSHMIN